MGHLRGTRLVTCVGVLLFYSHVCQIVVIGHADHHHTPRTAATRLSAAGLIRNASRPVLAVQGPSAGRRTRFGHHAELLVVLRRRPSVDSGALTGPERSCTPYDTARKPSPLVCGRACSSRAQQPPAS